MPIFYTNNTFNQYDLNPFDGNSPYSQEWILFKLIDKADDFRHLTTGGGDQVFRCIMTKEEKDQKYRLNDFIQYETTYNRNIILAVDDSDMAIAKAEYGAHRYDESFLRSYEPRVLVHSTTKETVSQASQNLMTAARGLDEDFKPLVVQPHLGERSIAGQRR